MRLWSIHPKYLDSRGLVALWREALLARKVLQGRTRGYKKHPQLKRFRQTTQPVRAINAYLSHVHAESCRRGYCFDESKFDKPDSEVCVRSMTIHVSRGQLEYEFRHLKSKLRQRDATKCGELLCVRRIEPHPMFRATGGGIEAWEKAICQQAL